MRANAVTGIAGEARSGAGTLRRELAARLTGPVSVGGALAEQLARELGAGAEAGAVQVGGDAPSTPAEVFVRVVAGDPTDADRSFVRAADALLVPVVIVQLWPQAEWTVPFVLSPFVVECRAGEGFPVTTIADRIVEATERSALLASRVPALRGSVERKVVARSVVRAALLGALSGKRAARPLITAEQLRMVARLNAAGDSGGAGIRDEPAALAGVLGVVLASGLALREVARTARFVLPAPVANAAVAAGGTWALARAAKAYSSRSAF